MRERERKKKERERENDFFLGIEDSSGLVTVKIQRKLRFFFVYALS